MYPIQYIADTNILWKIINNSILLSGYSNPMKFRGDPWNSREQFPRNSINLFNPPWNFFPYVKIFIDHKKLKYQFNFCISLIDGNFDANENLSW